MAHLDSQGVDIRLGVEGEGSPLLLLHGMGGSAEDWYEFGYAAGLKDHHRLILPDLRGHGQSGKPHRADAYSIDLYALDVVAVLDRLKIESCHLLGFSFGGWVAYRMLRKHPERLRSVILMDGVPGPDDAQLIRGYADRLEEVVSESPFPPARKKRMLRNDRAALRCLASGIAEGIADVIDDIQGLSGEIDMAGLILTSDLASIEMQLLLKLKSVISRASFETLAGLTHQELLMRGDLTIPRIVNFLELQEG